VKSAGTAHSASFVGPEDYLVVYARAISRSECDRRAAAISPDVVRVKSSDLASWASRSRRASILAWRKALNALLTSVPDDRKYWPSGSPKIDY